ncbi:transcription factor cwo [Culex quinquefasciatus]|uniref:transcription factor cwo n=1 Tax=Culex quinquefasciatus TaxID=7176 RepID=UPI0018E340D5|nr:transcription factor cwo [Culex quinquefasciatus]
MEGYWEAANGHAPHPVKYESEASVPGYSYCNEQLNFSTTNTTYSEDDADFAPGRRGKTSRQDPLSHRIIEKRRRDRMNSCLADLSRLIPQQYMRKGRGRVEKTEIIEMAIRHLKNLQNQECLRESSCAEQYRLGYNECLTEAAKFILRERGEETCYRMVTHLKEHCSELMKGELMKSRCGSEIPNGVSSPVYLHPGPLSQLRDMLSCPSDMEHSSNDHHDVKDLSFRSSINNGSSHSSSNNSSNNPPQAAVITSTAPSSVQHLDTSSNHSTTDFEASSPSRISTSSTSGIGNGQMHHHSQDTNNNINAQHESVLRTIRMRKFSETSPEHDHSHNSYKFKNYIQQRFSQDTHGNENGHMLSEVAHSPSSVHEDHHHLQMADVPPPQPLTGKSLVNGVGSKSKPESATSHHHHQNGISDEPLSLKRKAPSPAPTTMSDRDDLMLLEKKPAKNGLTEIKNEHAASRGPAGYLVPIFACHRQGFYVPMNVDYEALQPYLNGIDLFGKSSWQHPMPPLHPISISVNYAPLSTGQLMMKASAAAAAAATGNVKLVEGMLNGC